MMNQIPFDGLTIISAHFWDFPFSSFEVVYYLNQLDVILLIRIFDSSYKKYDARQHVLPCTLAKKHTFHDKGVKDLAFLFGSFLIDLV
jgi:hypothetical protein